jgi:uncharacterized SAM-binding protein YcdF (DUF218 family)
MLKRLQEVLERFICASDDQHKETDAIVCIGTDVSRDGRSVSPQSQAIVDLAAKLVEEGLTEEVVFTGGYSAGGPTEADAMQGYWLKSGYPYIKQVSDRASTNTRQNALQSLWIADELGWKKLVVVSQQLHARRVRATFRKVAKDYKGIEVQVIKAWSPYGGGSQNRFNSFWRFLAWEMIGTTYFWLRGWY